MSRAPHRVLAATVLALSVTSFARADGARLLVLNKSDNTIDFVDSTTMTSVATLGTGVGPHEVALSPDGRTAVVANYGAEAPGNTLGVYDTVRQKLLRVIDLGPYGRPHGIQYENAGHVLVTVEQNQAVLRVDLDAGEVVAEMKTGQSGTHMLVVSPDRTRVYTANIGSGTMSAIDLRSGELIANVATGEGAEGIDITPDGREVWVTNREADTVSVVDTEKLAVVHQLPCPSFPIRAKVTPDGKHVLVSNPRSGDVTVFHTETHLEVRRIPMKLEEGARAEDGFFGEAFAGSPQPIGILITPDGRRAFVANTSANAVTVLDLETWKAVGNLATGRQPDGLGWAEVTGAAE
jgi:YVTN family beta-propeller protein